MRILHTMIRVGDLQRSIDFYGSSGISVGEFRGLTGRKAAPALGFRGVVEALDLA
jgi:catechol 2,3-dioxygenase-like lactoylglutathione lyase family enzyme